jgi:PX domain
MINLKPKIINHETETSGKIAYVLEVTDEQTGRAKVTKLRYSEFKNLHEDLEKLVSKLKLHIILPEFPSRKLFGSTNKSEESIFERKKELNNVPRPPRSTSTTCSPSRSSTASTS